LQPLGVMLQIEHGFLPRRVRRQGYAAGAVLRKSGVLERRA
jgi:hypothetical protein